MRACVCVYVCVSVYGVRVRGKGGRKKGMKKRRRKSRVLRLSASEMTTRPMDAADGRRLRSATRQRHIFLLHTQTHLHTHTLRRSDRGARARARPEEATAQARHRPENWSHFSQLVSDLFIISSYFLRGLFYALFRRFLLSLLNPFLEIRWKLNKFRFIQQWPASKSVTTE